jgi:ABC-type sugar transport system permease subunit
MLVRRISDSTAGLIVALSVTAGTLALVGYPVVSSLAQSFYSTNPVLHRNQFVGIENYQALVTDPKVLNSFILTLKFVTVTVLISTTLALIFALTLNETFRGKAFVVAIVLIPFAISEVVTGILWSTMLNPSLGIWTQAARLLGFTNPNGTVVWLNPDLAIYLVALAYSWHIVPLATFFLLAALGTVPEDMYRAAKVDGAHAFARFLNVSFPFIRYSLLIVLVFVTALAFRAFDIIYAMTFGGPGASTQVLSMLIYLNTFQFTQFGVGAALSWILVLITITISAVYFYFLAVRKKKARAVGIEASE